MRSRRMDHGITVASLRYVASRRARLLFAFAAHVALLHSTTSFQPLPSHFIIGGIRQRRRLSCARFVRKVDYGNEGDVISSSLAVNGETPALDSYEAALTELESDVLYGTTPVMNELDQLSRLFEKGRLDLAPKYQRGYVWKQDRASRLVVTALCNRIIPGIVLNEKTKGTFEVVDGKQRLTTLLSFYLAGENPMLFHKLCQQYDRYHQRQQQHNNNNNNNNNNQASSTSSTSLASKGLFTTLGKLDENYELLEGLTYDQLSQDRQLALASYKIPCTIIPLNTPKEEVFSCYEDINSGGEDLKVQQLRRAVYYGPYIEMLDRLAANPDFQCIREPKSVRSGTYKLCPKESDRELILRAFAWARNFAKYKRPLKTFLNQELQHYDTLGRGDPAACKRELERLSDEFTFVMKVWRNVFSEDDGAFRAWTVNQRTGGKWGWSPSISVSMWDVMYSVASELRHHFPTEPVYAANKGKLKETIKNLFASGRLEVSSPVTVTKFMSRRYTISSALYSILSQGGKGALEPRTFPRAEELRKQLFDKQEGLCSICGNTIDPNRLDDGSYVQLDHIVPYSKGGSSTPDNAALVHASCNQSKGARSQVSFD